jgi:acetylxylan esterase
MKALLLLCPVFALATMNHRQGRCPGIRIFGARETTAPPGFGSASTVIDLIRAANQDATAEPILYPAAPGAQYAGSVRSGIAAIETQTQSFNQICPRSRIVMVGYSQVHELNRIGTATAS